MSEFGENRSAENATITVTTTSTELLKAVPERDFFYIYNGTAGSFVTVKLGEGDAVANQGVVLAYGQAYAQSDDSGFRAWRGRVVAVSTGTSTVSKQTSVRVR